MRPAVLAFLGLAACPHVTRVPGGPPVADVRPTVREEHGVQRPDPYAWLADRDDPAVRPYLEAENAWTDASTAHLDPLRKVLLTEMTGRLVDDQADPPERDGDWWYQEGYAPGADYPRLLRWREGSDGKDVVVDYAELAAGHGFFDWAHPTLTPDQQRFAVDVDFEGDEIYDVRFRDLTTGQWLPDVIHAVDAGGEWANDGQSFFYVRRDEALRPYAVYRHVLGTDESSDALVYQEDDRRFSTWLSKTRSDAFVIVTVASMDTSEIRVLDADHAEGPLRVLVPRHEGVMVAIEHQGDRFLALTNGCAVPATCVEYRVVALPLDADGLDDGTEWIPARPGVTIEEVDAFADHVVVSERRDGAVHLVVYDASGESREVPIPEPYYEVWLDENPSWDATTLRFGYDSLVTPQSELEYDFATGAMELLHQDPIPDWNAAEFTSERLSATSADGTAVPITLVRQADARGPGPLLLYGYGAYGVNVDPWFESSRVSLLNRGVSFALCAVRGGGDLGQQWYLDGKLDEKQHTFDDFAACAQALIDQGYTTAAQLAITGMSAGGLLIAASVTQHPELFHAAVAQVPFVDVVTTMLDDSIPLTAEEWEEWGDPHRKADFDWMLAYSPYDNVTAQRYPDLLVTAGWNDTSVLYHEPTKWVARLRATNPGGNVLLRINMGAGHMGSSGRYGELEDEAFIDAWVLDELGLGGP